MKTIVVALVVLSNFCLAQDHARQQFHTTPRIVAKQVFRNQIGPIQDTTLYQPTKDGEFRISVYFNLQAAAPQTSPPSLLCVNLHWTDDFRSWDLDDTILQLARFGINACYGGDYITELGRYVFSFHSRAGTPIIINGALPCNPAIGSCQQDTTSLYNAYVELEKL